MGKDKKFLIGMGITIGIIVLGLFAFTPKTLQEYIPHERTISVAEGTYTVDPTTTRVFEFSVPYGATNARLELQFEAKGGFGDDIIVKVVDSYGTVLYNSGKVTSSYATVNLPGGDTYYLVLDNSFSLISPKKVYVSATLIYIK
jgi:hypothetical protein